MPYDIHLGEAESQARAELPELSLDYSTHRAIFEESNVELYDLHLFYNLSDFYQNACFLGSHVIGLRADVEEARRRIHHPRATEPLSLLSKLCDRAIKSEKSLFAFGE
ncbi:MAG: hypothetical protein AAF191_12905 [Verrucomicrobiota bacterium]